MAFTCNFWSRSLLKLFFIFRFIPWFFFVFFVCVACFSVCIVVVVVTWMMMVRLFFFRWKLGWVCLGIVVLVYRNFICLRLRVCECTLCECFVALLSSSSCEGSSIVYVMLCYFFFFQRFLFVCLFTSYVFFSSPFVCLLLLRRLDQVDD